MNPWPWMLALLLIIGGFLSGYRIGAKATAGEYEKAASKAMTAMIERHNEIAKADTEAAVKAEKQRQAWRIKLLEGSHELELEAARNHRPECAWTEREVSLLNDIVDSANGKQPHDAASHDKPEQGLSRKGYRFLWPTAPRFDAFRGLK